MFFVFLVVSAISFLTSPRVSSLRCYERYQFLNARDESVNGTLKQRVCPKGTSTCADALVSFSDANGAKIRISAKFCGGGGGENGGGAEASGVGRNDDEGDEVDKLTADDDIDSSLSSSSLSASAPEVAEETKWDASTSGTSNSNGVSDVVNDAASDAASDSGGADVTSKLDFCEGINATATLKGWSDVSCVETKCASDLCNGLECYQPQRHCIANLTKTGKPTLRDVADCPVEGRQCEMLDASACVSIEVKTRTEAVKLKKCHRKGELTFCQRVLQRGSTDAADCRETFCVTSNCNKPEVAEVRLIAIIAAVVLAVALIVVVALVTRICCCEDTGEKSKTSKPAKNRNENRSETKPARKKWQIWKKKDEEKEIENAEKCSSSVSLVRQFEASKTKDQEDSYFDVSDFDY